MKKVTNVKTDEIFVVETESGEKKFEVGDNIHLQVDLMDVDGTLESVSTESITIIQNKTKIDVKLSNIQSIKY